MWNIGDNKVQFKWSTDDNQVLLRWHLGAAGDLLSRTLEPQNVQQQKYTRAPFSPMIEWCDEHRVNHLDISRDFSVKETFRNIQTWPDIEEEWHTCATALWGKNLNNKYFETDSAPNVFIR